MISFFELSAGSFGMIEHLIVSYVDDTREYNTSFSLFEFRECITDATMNDETASLVISLYTSFMGLEGQLSCFGFYSACV